MTSEEKVFKILMAETDDDIYWSSVWDRVYDQDEQKG